ncbi:MAG: alkaline phosphatase D family protein, partial [Planctomycetota bacterium]
TLLRVRGHDTSNAHDFRVVMNGEGDTNAIYAFHVPAEPTGDVVVGGVSCTGVMGRIWGSHRDRLRPGERFSGRWTESNVWMPWEGVTDPLLQREPDIVFFTGDQLYESNPTPRDAKDSFPVEDYLYKWLIWHWSFQEVTRRVPVVLQTDDHDVWHPNLWGDGGRLMTSGGDPGGGYLKSIYFVNLVHRTMAGHNPDAYWPGPLDSGVLNYFTTFTYGGVDFAVLEDRKFKSARIDETRQALPPQLLGNTQLAMLEAWAEDPDASTARVVVSQTNYVNLATRRDTGELSKDRDSHGWPKPARDRAVELFERAGALLFTGDQHLASVSRLETETGPGVVQFCQPAGGCIWWRWFYPNTEAHHGTPGDPSYLGRFTDGFGNPFEVMAVANPAPEQELPRRFNPQRHAVNPTEWEAGVGTTKRIHQGEGFAILHLEPDRDRATLECWPYGADADAGPDGQFSDWPIELRLPASR